MDATILPLSRATVDRAAHRRSVPDVLASVWAHAGTRLVLVHDGKLAVHRTAGDGVELDLRSPADLDGLGPDGPPDAALCLLLGESADAAFLAVVLPDGGAVGDPVTDAVERLVSSATWATLRDVGHRLGDRDTGLAATAIGLAAWHERHPRCVTCGGTTVAGQGGWTRRCTVEGKDHYPRTDPAVIMAVLDDDDRILLGHAAHWPEGRFSTLAGYVEPGESLEAAVRREVAEEVGVVVGDVIYEGSQPWPFPASLMVGFRARATTTTIRVDGEEVTDARWFTRPELSEALAQGTLRLPMRTSIARALIEDWYGGRIDD